MVERDVLAVDHPAVTVLGLLVPTRDQAGVATARIRHRRTPVTVVEERREDAEKEEGVTARVAVEVEVVHRPFRLGLGLVLKAKGGDTTRKFARETAHVNQLNRHRQLQLIKGRRISSPWHRQRALARSHRKIESVGLLHDRTLNLTVEERGPGERGAIRIRRIAGVLVAAVIAGGKAADD